MPSYDVLDRIADAHNPLLGLIWIALVFASLLRRRWGDAGRGAGLGLFCLVVAYGLEYVDVATGLWPRMGLDYSTHTAVAVAMVATLFATSRTAGRVAMALFVLYVPLMLYQRYHGPGDIVTTVLAVGLVVAWPAWRLRSAMADAKAGDDTVRQGAALQ